MAFPVWIIRTGCQSQITLVQCRGAKSHVYDMYAGQGVVSSRAVFVYCDLLRLSSDRVFCSIQSSSIHYTNRRWLIFHHTHTHTQYHLHRLLLIYHRLTLFMYIQLGSTG